MNRVLASTPMWLQPDPSPRWVAKAIGVLLVLLLLQAHPDMFIIATWIGFVTALVTWAYRRKTDLARVDLTDTQPIPVIRHVRCPRCGKEQLGPADSIIDCAGCDKRMRIPAPGRIAVVTCPRCNTEQEAEEGARHTCEGCGYTDFVARSEDVEAAAATGASDQEVAPIGSACR